MPCLRCGAEKAVSKHGWCVDCERVYDVWVRQHAADIVWQAFSGAGITIIIAMGLPLLGFAHVIALAGVGLGLSTFLGVRHWGKQRRRRQFLDVALPRAYLPSHPR